MAAPCQLREHREPQGTVPYLVIIVYNVSHRRSRGSPEFEITENIVVQQSLLRACSGRQPRVIDRVDAVVDEGEVLRYLGYPAGMTLNPRLRGMFDRWVDAANRRATPRAAYVVLPVAEIGRGLLRLQTPADVVEFKGAIGEFLGPSRFVAAFIATAGPAVERLASELLGQREELAAMIVNAVGAERAEAAESAVIERLREQARPEGFAPTLPYSPGYCGMSLAQQNNLFALFGDETVGVTLTGDCLMRPLKSVSGLIGLGPADEINAHGSPCDRCELYNCAMRR